MRVLQTAQRQLSIVLIAILGLSLVPPAEATHTAVPPTQWVAYFEDFENYYAGYELDVCYYWVTCSNWKEYPDVSPSRYYFNEEGDNTFVEDPPVASSDPIAHFTPASYDSYLSSTSKVGSFRALLRTDKNDTWYNPWVLLTDSSKINPTTKQILYYQSAVMIRMGGDGNLWAYGSNASRNLGPYPVGEWVTIDVDLNANGTYDVCVDGKPRYRGIPFYSAPTVGVNTIALWSTNGTARPSTVAWDDLLLAPKNMDFCLNYDPAPAQQDYWNFEGIGDLYSDDQIRKAAVDAFADCIDQVNENRQYAWYPYHGCPVDVAGWETMIRDEIADAAEANADILPGIERPTEESPKPIGRPDVILEDIPGVFVPALSSQEGPLFPRADCCSPIPGPDAPAPLAVRTVPGPTLEMPELPDVEAEKVTLTPPETPGTTDVVVPLRDHDFEMDWSINLTAEELLDLVTPNVPDLPVVTGLPVDLAQPSSSQRMLDPDVEMAPPPDSPDFQRWAEERRDLIHWLEENFSVPDVRSNAVLPPLIFEIHTESRGQVKRTPALPLVPALINVDNNPTTGLLGYDVAVRISFTPLLNEVRMNVTRLAPWERNVPDMWEPVPDRLSDMVPDDVPLPLDVELVEPYPGGVIPGTPLDLTAYVIAPIPMPWPVETMVTQNPESILVGAAGFTTGGNDAPWAMEVAVAADSLLPIHPNTRFTLTMSSWEALDNLTLLGGVADALYIPGEEHDLSDVLGELQMATGPVVGPWPAPPFPEPAQEAYGLLVNSTAFRIGYAYEANNATLASVSFQPPPGVFTVDVAMPTNEDENTVIAFDSESSTDIRVVITDDRDLLTSAPRDEVPFPIDEVRPIATGPHRDVVNVRADKFPTELVITMHNDPYLPAAQIEYEGEHAIGRVHVVTGEDVVFPEDDANWTGGSFDFQLEGDRTGRADDVFHLNVSDLPKGLTLRTEGGDIRLEADAPVGRVAVTAASRVSPILPEGGDGLHYEQDGARTRIGLVIHGVQGFSAVTSEPTQTFRWDMVGDQGFAVNVSLGDESTGTDVRALVSNLPPELMFATDAASFAAMENSNAIYGIDAYVVSHGTGFEAELHVVDLPEALAARFNFTAGDLEMRAAQPIGEITATARLPGSDLSTIRLHVEDLPSFEVGWSIVEDNISATFDAEGNGIGLLEFQGGGDALLSIPSLANADHAFLLEGAHPLAPVAIGARIANLQHVSADIAPTGYHFRTEHARPEPLTVILDMAELRALGRIDPVPATVDVRVSVGDEVHAVYEATQVIDRVAMWVWSDAFEGFLDARLIPQRVDVSLTNDTATNGLRGDVRNQGRLGSLQAQVRAPEGSTLFGTPWRNAYARLEGLPEEVTVKVAEGHVSFDTEPGALTLVEAAVSNGSQLTMLQGDHVRLIGNASGDTVEASARVTGLSYLAATFQGEMDIRIENEHARPFTAVADYPHFGIYGAVRVLDLPASLKIQTNLKDRHLYEASSVIGRIDAYGKIGTMEAWLGLEDVPARVKVLVNATEGAVEAFVLSSSRLQEARVDVRDPNGIFNTTWKAAYAKVQGLPEVLSFRMDRTGAEFGTEHDMIALVEGAASSELQLYTVEGDHLVYVNETRRIIGCDLKECPPPLPGLLASFRLRGLEGARVTFGSDELAARLETKDGRSFVALVSIEGLRACLTVSNLPTVMEFRSDLEGSHVYDATSIISDLTLQAKVNTTQLYFGLKDLPRHIHVTNNVTEAGGEARVWMDSDLQDVLLDVFDPIGLGGTEWKRARLHIESIPRELKVTWDETGADFGTGDDQIGLIEFWAADSLTLSELAGDHVRFEDRCPLQRDEQTGGAGRGGFCGKAISARITGLKAARFSMTDADGLNARLETQGPRVFRAMYHQQTDWSNVGAEVVVTELPAVLAVRSDLQSRFVYEASGIVDEITLRASKSDNETALGAAARLVGLPARIEVEQSFGANGGSATYLASSPIRLIEIEAYDWMGLGDTDFLRAVARVRELPSFLSLQYTPTAEGLEASFQSGGDSIGLLEAGLTTGYGLPATIGNGVYLDKSGDKSLTATGRIAGFSGASVRVEGDSLAAGLKFAQAAPFESIANIDGTFAYGLIDAVPAEVTVTASLPSSIVYAATSPIENIVLYVEQPTEKDVDRILRADITTVPQTMRVSIDEAEGIVHFTSSEAIGGLKLQVFDPEMVMGFHNVFAEVKHVPANMRLKYNGTMQLDASEGVDTIVFQATSIGDYPVYDGSHAVIREIIAPNGETLTGISAKISGLKFVEVAVHDRFTLAEVKLRESQAFKAYYETYDVNKKEGAQVIAHFSNIPKEIKVQRVEGPGNGEGSILYEGSERIGNLRFAAIMSEDEYYDLSLDNLPSELSIEYKFDEDTPWFARYVADAPTQVHFEMPTSMGPLELDALVQNLQFSILDVPSAVPDVSLSIDVGLFPPSVDVNLELKWSFVIATDTDFLPNAAKLSLGLFHSEDFDLAVILDGDLLAQDWLYKASIVVKIGTDTGITFEIDTVGGHAFAQLCIGAYVRYDPWGFEDTFNCIIELGGVYPDPDE